MQQENRPCRQLFHTLPPSPIVLGRGEIYHFGRRKGMDRLYYLGGIPLSLVTHHMAWCPVLGRLIYAAPYIECQAPSILLLQLHLS